MEVIFADLSNDLSIRFIAIYPAYLFRSLWFKELTISNYLSQRFFWKNVSPFRNNCSNFWKNSQKIRPHYGWISKIPSHGRWAWKNLFLTSISFFPQVIFWSLFKISKKWLQPKKLQNLKNQFLHEHQPCERFFEIG